eukprot:TRINITY_DN18156_c0_g1_i1.p1 TRINITY_DN18156_c0_g1~~TRINITY_DN18156_c0_g1_i1.p1  ORF type:complete len:370 (-),score=54.59 TRINITY_DN18156_c0_g1_i1:355-1464(-)
MLKLSELKMASVGYSRGQYSNKRYLWTKGSPEGWYSFEHVDWVKILKKSLLAHTGLELIVYIVIYYIINITYRAGLEDDQKKQFENIVAYFEDGVDGMPKDLTFILGFYVNMVIKRWWEQYKLIPWPDTMGLLNTGLTLYEGEEAKRLSEEILRYEMLSFILCIRKISKVVRKEFPTSTELIDAGVATPAEIKSMENKGDLDTLWWIPLQWAMHRVKMAKQAKMIPSDHKEALREINRFWSKLKDLESHLHVPIPPVYKQVVKLAVTFYFAAALIGYQITDQDIDVYFPFFLVFKFIFYVGWYKVADALRNPFGDDGEDFEIGPLLSRHIWACGEHLEAGTEGPPPSSEDEEDNNGGLQEDVIVSVDKE